METSNVETRKRIDPDKELLLVFAFCLFRKQAHQELLDETPFDSSIWKRVGISQKALGRARAVLKEHAGCFADLNRAIHACMRGGCPDPPCPDEGSLSMLASAWRVTSSSKK